jgi:NDP-sugar pyrophosphorylase family protein
MNIVIPIAGLGTRFSKVGIDIPKPLIKVNNKTLIEHSLLSINIDANYIFITKDYKNKKYNEELTNLLKKIKPNSTEIKINTLTSGAAETCLYAKELIDNKEELIITNCDQIFDWDLNDFYSFIKNINPDGCIVLHKSNNPKHSYAIVNDNRIIQVKEKEVISNDALIGLHYWKHGKDFISSAENLINNISNNTESYISTTYQYLIDNNKSIVPFYAPQNSYISLGTPEDLDIYIAKIKEYYTEKPKTIFCDIDGTILKHAHKFSHVVKENAIELPGVIDKFNEWDTLGYKIVLTTARKESARHITEKQLTELGFCWDYLLMGITSGTRFLLNDKLKESDNDRAIAINLLTDGGFKDINWKTYGL